MGRRLAAMILVLIGVGAGCGGDDGAAPKESKAARYASVLELASVPGGKLRFDKGRLVARSGRILVRFRNTENVPHNAQIEQSARCCTREGARGFGGTKTTIHKGVVKGVVSLKPGKYFFYCSVGGHWQAGMQGTLLVR